MDVLNGICFLLWLDVGYGDDEVMRERDNGKVREGKEKKEVLSKK